MQVRGMRQQLPAATRTQPKAADQAGETAGIAAVSISATFQSRGT